MAKKVKAFCVSAKLNIVCNVEIKAESLEDAIRQARELRENDFVDIHGDFMDGDLHIDGVYEAE